MCELLGDGPVGRGGSGGRVVEGHVWGTGMVLRWPRQSSEGEMNRLEETLRGACLQGEPVILIEE